MTSKLFHNWLESIEHAYGRLACEALACQLIRRSTVEKVSELKPDDIIDIHRVISAFELRYEGREIPMPLFQWMLDFYQTTDYNYYDFGVEPNVLLATHNFLKIMLGIPTEDGVAPWMRSLLYSMTALDLSPRRFMPEAEQFLEHLR